MRLILITVALYCFWLALSGHYEFGPYRRAIHFGDDQSARAIAAA